MTDRLQERLEALRENPPSGDWLDVQRRVRHRVLTTTTTEGENRRRS